MDEESENQLAVYVVKTASPQELVVLQDWLSRLLSIREANISLFQKSRKAIAVTLDSKVVWPLIQMIAKKLKQHGWDERRSSSRFGIGGAAVGLALFGSQSLGLAGLGTAIGLPLWIVLGGGAKFAYLILKEKNQKPE